ncbi:MAG: PhoH family protein [Thermoguttaceae bacterium]
MNTSPSTISEQTVSIVNTALLHRVLGDSDRHLRLIRKSLGIQVVVDRNQLLLRGDADAVRHGAALFVHLQRVAERDALSQDDVVLALSELRASGEVSGVAAMEVYAGGRVRPRTAGQAKYVAMLRDHSVVFCTGPAGTGKTYLAVARAVEAFRRNYVKKIVLVRPAVEAGESLGFLPGDLQAKVNPYLRPLLDALADMMEHDLVRRYVAEDRIEIAPLAYMRGRTLNNAYIILDEAQNTTVAQMKMFLTRMGTSSSIIVCGDTTQIDLPNTKKSGLIDALERLRNIEGLGMLELNRDDIVRHPLVQRIVNAYETETTC